MKTLQHIIGLMNKEEVRHLKLFMGRTNAGEERKDVELFDYIRAHHEEYDETKIQHRLYGPRDKNALYRLKNRLLEDIGKSLSLQYVDENDFNEVVHQLVLARLFLSKSQSQVALHYLHKAEKKAQAADNPGLLDLVFSEYVRFSQETLEINPTEYIRKRKNNREQLNRVQEIDDILAEVVYKVRTTQNFSGQDYRMIESLRKKVNEISRHKDTRSSIQLRFKIYHSLSRILLQKQDFSSLEKYLKQTFEEFAGEGLFNRNNHDTKLQLLTYLANAQYKNGEIEHSLATAERLRHAMAEFGGSLHDKYLFFYYNILVINYSGKDPEKAIAILNEAKDNPVIKKLPFYIVFIYHNLTILNFDTGNYRQAIRHLVKLTMEQGYSNLDPVLRMKIAVAELIIRYELGDFDVLERRLEQVKKEFAEMFRTKEGKRHHEMIAILTAMYHSSSVRRDKILGKKIEKFIADRSGNSLANDVIDYNDWLHAKIS
ncbi:MAG: hypothetical protein HY064_13445 [Bacteroidetes bacterium]|nr:hypothetical protein [Bacteroidota bacterium]